MKRGCLRLELGGRWCVLDDRQDPNQSFLEAIKEQDSFLDIKEKYFEVEDGPGLLLPEIYEHIEDITEVGDPQYTQAEKSDFLPREGIVENKAQEAEMKNENQGQGTAETSKFGQSEFLSDEEAESANDSILERDQGAWTPGQFLSDSYIADDINEFQVSLSIQEGGIFMGSKAYN